MSGIPQLTGLYSVLSFVTGSCAVSAAHCARLFDCRIWPAISQSTEEYGRKLEYLKFLRDGSSGALLLGATWVTGGTALALVGGGSLLTGVGKYQDTGSIWSGVVAGGGAMVVGKCTMAGKALKMSGAEKLALLMWKGTVEGAATGFAPGATLESALLSGATTMIADKATSKLFDSPIVKNVLKKMPMPVKITAPGGMRAVGVMTKSLGREFVGGVAQFAADRQINDVAKVGGAAAIAAIKGDTAGKPVGRYGPLAQATPLPSTTRTSMAFVQLKGDQGSQPSPRK